MNLSDKTKRGLKRQEAVAQCIEELHKGNWIDSDWLHEPESTEELYAALYKLHDAGEEIPQKIIKSELRVLRECLAEMDSEATSYIHTWGQVAAFERLLMIWGEKSGGEQCKLS